GVRERPDTLRAQVKRPVPLHRRVERSLYLADRLLRRVAEELQRHVDALGPHPAHGTLWRGLLQLALQPLQHVERLRRQLHCDEQPPWFGHPASYSRPGTVSAPSIAHAPRRFLARRRQDRAWGPVCALCISRVAASHPNAVLAALRLPVDAVLGKLGELLVRFPLLVERLLHQVGDPPLLQGVGVSRGRAVGCDLVVLHLLRRLDQSRVQHLRRNPGRLLENFLALFNQAFHGLARHRGVGLLAELLERLLQPLDLLLRLLPVHLERLLELLVGGRLLHLRQGCEDHILRAVQVLQVVNEPSPEVFNLHSTSPIRIPLKLTDSSITGAAAESYKHALKTPQLSASRLCCKMVASPTIQGIPAWSPTSTQPCSKPSTPCRAASARRRSNCCSKCCASTRAAKPPGYG